MSIIPFDDGKEPDLYGIGSEAAKMMGKTSRTCHVCRNTYDIIGIVNRMLVNGASSQEVFDFLNGMSHDLFRNNKVPSVNSIRNHDRNHLPIKVNAIRRVMERRAAAHGKDVEDGTQNLVTNLGMLEVIAQQGFRDIVDGKQKPTVRETIEAIKLTEQFDRDAQQTFDAVEAFAQMNRIMTAIRNVLSEADMDRIVTELNRLESEGIEIIEGEVEEEEPFELETD